MNEIYAPMPEPKDVRASGGIVHSDGNVFFTNIEKMKALFFTYADATHALREAQRPQADAEWMTKFRRLATVYASAYFYNLVTGNPEAEADQDESFNALMAHAAQRPADPALASRPVPPPISDGSETQRGIMLSWAVDRWNAEVKNRPLINVHRRTLDDTWRQVMRYCGGNPSALVGPSHDDLLAASPKRNGIPIAEERTTQPQASRCGVPECFGKPMCQKCSDQQIKEAVGGYTSESQWKGGV